MGTSSKPTSGEALTFASDIIKLLSPVLKNANQDQIDSLKKRSAEVQQIFRNLLEGRDPVKDYGIEKTSYLDFVNRSGIEFDPNLVFVIRTELAQDDEWGSVVYISAEHKDSREQVNEWEVEFDDILPPMYDAFVSLLSFRTHDNLKMFFSNAQDELLADRGVLTFLAPGDTESYAIELKCGKYHTILGVSFDFLQQLSKRCRNED